MHFPAAWSGFQGCSMVFVSRELQKPRVARYGEWGWMMAIEAHGALGPCSAHAAAFHRCESQMFEREAPNHTEPNTAHTQAHTHTCIHRGRTIREDLAAFMQHQIWTKIERMNDLNFCRAVAVLDGRTWIGKQLRALFFCWLSLHSHVLGTALGLMCPNDA